MGPSNAVGLIFLPVSLVICAPFTGGATLIPLLLGTPVVALGFWVAGYCTVGITRAISDALVRAWA
jgi:hypothetical protein